MHDTRAANSRNLDRAIVLIFRLMPRIKPHEKQRSAVIGVVSVQQCMPSVCARGYRTCDGMTTAYAATPEKSTSVLACPPRSRHCE